MKVLIAEAGGQLANALEAAAPAGAAITALTEIELDITDWARLEAAVAAVKADVIIYAAAFTAVDKVESLPERARLINADAVGWMAAAARAAGSCFVHISIDFVFDGESGHTYAIDAATNPLGIYGLTKRNDERAALAAHPDALIVHTGWLYAAHGANFVLAMLRLMAERNVLQVVEDQIGSPTYATSLARALWRLSGASGVLHYTDAGVASWYDFAVAIQEEALAASLLAKAIPVTPVKAAEYPTPARRPAFSVPDKDETWRRIGGPAPHWRANLRTMMQERKRYG